MQNILNFLYDKWQSIVSLLQDFTTYLLDKAFVIILDSLIWFSDVGFGLISSIFTGLSYDNQINAYAAQLHPTFGYIFDALNIATYIQIIVAAYITRLVLKLILPGL